MASSKIIFMHIPKTGGETFTNEIIARNVPHDRLLFGLKGTKEFTAFKNMPVEEKEKLDCVAGHVHFGVHELFESPCKYLTYVRDPVERIISTYYFTLRTKDHIRHAEVQDLSLLDYALSQGDLEMENYQVRLLGGNPVDEVGPAELAQAEANIEKHFICVGLTERFDASLLVIAKLLGFSNIYYNRWNVSQNKKLDQVAGLDEVKQAILARNQLDAQLHEFCAQRLEAQLQANGLDQAAVLQYLIDNVAFQEKSIQQREQALERLQEEINERLDAWEQEMEQRQLAHDRRVIEFNSLPLVKSVRGLKKIFPF
jgi:sulfotransferase famil protein